MSAMATRKPKVSTKKTPRKEPPEAGSIIAPPAASLAELATVLMPSLQPLLLLPVRLETRFFGMPDSSVELRVRIYPDKVHIDAHDPALSAEESAWGRRYWQLQWHAGGDEARLRSAWRMLADRFEPQRGAWIARATQPLNPQDRPKEALPDEAALPADPKFPDAGPPPTRSRTPVARLLPDRWFATVYQNGVATAVGKGRDIVPELAVGPDMQAALASGGLADDSPAIDEGMRWMVEFERAEEVGMALRIPLPSTLPSVSVERLLVTGVKASLDPQAAAAQCAALFDAHHHTDGLAFIAPGTPSNNIVDERSGDGTPDPAQQSSYDSEWQARAPAAGSNADLTARALGLDAAQAEASFGRIAGAQDQEQAAAAAMQTALWPATWGYFLSQMVGFDGSLTLDACDWARAHAIAHLRPGGPLPALRCGRQPYGLLPVSALDLWTPTLEQAQLADDFDGARGAVLRGLLRSLRDGIWRPATSKLPRIGLGADPNADLADVLRRDALSSSVLVRKAMGRHYLQHLRLFLGENLDALGFWTRLDQLTAGLPAQLGLAFKPFLSQVLHDETAHALTLPLVQAEPPAEGDPRAANYIAELLALEAIDKLAVPVPQTAMPLLQALLRHALLREHAMAAAKLLATPALPATQLLRDAELVDLLHLPAPTPSWNWQRSQPVPGVTPPIKVGPFLNAARDFGTPALASLGEFRAGLGRLAASDAATLQRHVAGTLDACSHRLDAWITSLATRRLAQMRSLRATGLAIGGYGWVEQLRPAAPSATIDPPPGESAPLALYADDPGYLLAPSINQAMTAALLRNAHLSHGAAADGPLAIDLSSSRVRIARHLFDGVRQGQSLGALLGYGFERRLHEAGLDEYLDDFRRIAPRPDSDAESAGVQRQVLDGLVLRKLWLADREGLLARLVPPIPEGDARRVRMVAALDVLDATIDAAADAVSAESVHQLVRGNLARSAASLDAIASGQAPPPQLDFVRTPRSGIGLTHRVALVFPAAPSSADGSGWAGADQSPRARAEPALEAWARRLLGPATGVAAQVEQLDPASGALTRSLALPLAALGLGALDFLCARIGNDGQPSEIELRLLDAAWHPATPADAPPRGALLRLNTARRDGAPPAERSLADLLEIAAAAQRVLGSARPLDAADLQAPHAEPEGGWDLDEFEIRAARAEDDLAAARSGLALPATAGAAAWRSALLAAAALGVTAAIPSVAAAADEAAALQAQAGAAAAELAQRRAQLDALNAAPPPATPQARRERQLDRSRAVFGPAFVALPRFSCGNGADIAQALADRSGLLGDDPFAAYTWFQRMERVRAPLTQLGFAVRGAELLRHPERLQLDVAQLPHRPGQRWIGLEIPPGSTVTEGCLSLVLQGAAGIDFTQAIAGLLVDEWVEMLPSRNETTAIAFQFDPPDSCAPQALLLAVPPAPGQDWTLGSLNQVLLETLDLARLRAVDPASLGAIAQYLPATYLAFNADGDAVATDLHPLTL